MCDLNDNPIKLSVKWNGKEYEMPELSPSDSVAMLKIAIENATGVRPERQKLLNVKFQGNYIQLFVTNFQLKFKVLQLYFFYYVITIYYHVLLDTKTLCKALNIFAFLYIYVTLIIN